MADFAFLSLRAQSGFSTTGLPRPQPPADGDPEQPTRATAAIPLPRLPALPAPPTPIADTAETPIETGTPEDRKLRILLKAIQQLYANSGKTFDAETVYARIRKSESLAETPAAPLSSSAPPPAAAVSAQQLDASHTSVDGQTSTPGQDPLIVDLQNDGVALSRAADGVSFDIRGGGTPELTAWTAGDDDAFLALDRNGNGRVDDGRELFGDQHGARHGFAELARFDDNRDGMIDAGDPVYTRLRLWLDRDHDGITGNEELTTLLEQGILALHLRSRDASYADGNGNLIIQTGSYTRMDGGHGGIIDAILDVRG